MALTSEQEKECATVKAMFKEKAGMTQREFVEKYDAGTPGNLNQYFQGRRALNAKLAAKLAHAMGVEVSEFSPRLAKEIAGLKSDNVKPVLLGKKKIPLFSSIRAGLPCDIGQPATREACIEHGDYLVVDDCYPDECFGLTVEGRSMETEFYEGDLLIIDPTLEPHPGDFVVADIQDGGTVTATFKKYRERGLNEFGQRVFELVPLNPDFPTLYSDKEPYRIVGVMIEHRRKYRRRHF